MIDGLGIVMAVACPHSFGLRHCEGGSCCCRMHNHGMYGIPICFHGCRRLGAGERGAGAFKPMQEVAVRNTASREEGGGRREEGDSTSSSGRGRGGTFRE